MRRWKFVGLVIGLVTGMTVGPTSAQTLSFDRFLNGFDGECKTNDAFNDFHDSVVERTLRGGKTRLPSNLRASFGAARIKKAKDYFDVYIPLSQATWRGVPLAGFSFYMGEDNGINGVSVVFDARSGDVRRVFGANVQASARAMKNDPENEVGFTIMFGTIEGKPAITCDRST